MVWGGINMEYVITEEMVVSYREYLYEEEKESATIEKYIRDLRKLISFADGREVSKKLMIAYKESLKSGGRYKISSINSFLVAANRFLEYMKWYEFRVKIYKVQRELFQPEEKDLTEKEYRRLVRTAESSGKKRLALLIQTICATGIRVSELEMITVNAVKRGTANIYCKGKGRQVLIPRSLQVKLLGYIRRKGLQFGPVFCTSGGKPLDRSNIWKEMKGICEAAGVEREKVFPHNLRHLFAKIYYQIGKDIGKLADILGHSSIETTRIYIKTSSQEHRQLLEKMKVVLNI